MNHILQDIITIETFTLVNSAIDHTNYMLQKSTFDVYQKMWQLSVKYDENNVKSHAEGIKKVMKGNYIYLGEMTGVAPLIYKDCQFAVAKETFFPSSFAFVMSENSPYLPAFNKM